jgi:hypothetical protein
LDAELATLKAANRMNLLRLDGQGKETFRVFIWDALKERGCAQKSPRLRSRQGLRTHAAATWMSGAFLALAWNGKLPEDGDTGSLLDELLFNTDGLSLMLKSDANVDTELFADRDTLK